MIETKFKECVLGMIPEEWNAGMFQDFLATFSSGATPYRGVPENFKGNIRWISSGELNYNVIYETIEHISEEAVTRTNLKVHQPGTFLMAITGLEAAGTRGRCAIVGSPSTTNQSCLAINETEKMGTDYLYWFYNFWSETLAFKYAQGTKQQSFAADIVRKLPIYCPSDKAEQSRIAKALSDIDSLIMQLDKLIEKKRAIKQGAMQQLLTGKVRLKGFTEPWKERKLGEDSTILRGGSPRPIEEFITDRPDGLNWIKIGDVKPNDKYLRKTAEKIKKEGLTKTRQVFKGDFILSNSMSFGRPYILDIDGCIHDGWLVIQNYQEAYDMQFLYYILCSDAIINQYISMAAGSSVQNLNKEKVANVLLYAPTSLKEQSAIAAVLSSIDDEIIALETKKTKYEQIKQGMMQLLLTGKIRLIEAAAKTNNASANVHFRRSVLAAEIADRLCDEPTFGHVKMEKILFLSERMCRIDIGSHYHRDAAGPYDNSALRSIDSQLKKQKWFEVKHTDKGNRYVPMQNRGKHSIYFTRYYADVLPTFKKIISTFKTWNTERCEIVATLYSAWEDMQKTNKSFTDADIVNEVLNNWHESKKRISQERWLNALQWMRNNGFTPVN